MKSGQNVWLWLTLGATTFGVVTACTAADGGGPTQSATCTVGSYNCTCNVDGSCQPGLVCTNGLCAVPGDGTGGGSAVGTGGGSAVGTGGGAAAICAAGQQQSCLGPGDCVGTQTCLADGTAFGPCVCPIVGSGGAPTGVGGAPGMGGANVQVCVPNSVNPCYGTANCLGSQTCLADGSGYTTCDCTSAGSGGAATGSGGSASCGEHTGDSGIIPDDEGNFIKDWNVSGLVGSWYTYADDGGSTIESAYTDPADPSSIGNSDGEFCFSGTSVGHNDADYDTNWGSAVAFDVCKMPDDTCFLPQTMRDAASAGEQFSAGECPSSLTGVTSITFTISGTWSTELRLNFKQDASDSVQSPFVILDSADTYTITAASAEVPDWADNYPETGVAADILSIQFQFSSMAADTTFDVCLSNITVN